MTIRNDGDTVGNTVAVVTGAAQGIGAAITEELCERGFRVVALDRQSTYPEALTSAISRGRVLPLVADVTSRDDVATSMERARQEFGRLDVVVANAGFFRPSPFLDVDEPTWERHLAVNLTGVFNVCQLGARLMVAAGRPGSIVVVTSIAAEIPSRGTAPYVASKGGAQMLAEAMAWELGDRGIRVNCVAPGIVDTPLNADYLVDEAARARIGAQVPLGRVATPGDVAHAVAYLAGDESEYVTGVTIRVDGGRFLGWVP